MSAPDTNTKTEERKHKPALIGIRASIIAGVALTLALIFWVTMRGEEPATPETRIDGRTGEKVIVD